MKCLCKKTKSELFILLYRWQHKTAINHMTALFCVVTLAHGVCSLSSHNVVDHIKLIKVIWIWKESACTELNRHWYTTHCSYMYVSLVKAINTNKHTRAHTKTNKKTHTHTLFNHHFHLKIKKQLYANDDLTGSTTPCVCENLTASVLH